MANDQHVVEDQAAVMALLEQPSTHGGEDVDRIDTHTAVVFLAGARALKLKRAVRFDYVDFSTPDKRHAACDAEVRVNRRTAPGLYRGVVAVTREPDGQLALGGDGPPADWLVDMVRFDQSGLFDRLAAAGDLDLALMQPLAEEIAALHTGAATRHDHGGAGGMRWVIEGNAESFAADGGHVFDSGRTTALTGMATAELGRQAGRLDRRRDAGLVRECHGDLHLRNIVRIAGRPVLFDAIEFNDDISCIDTLYDVAFLLMDLWRRELPAHANAVFNGYVSATGDAGDLGLLPLFLSCRAAVRAKTSVSASRVQASAAEAGRLEDRARRYLGMAIDLLRPVPPSLVAIGGRSGTGKSTLARQIAPGIGAPPGALVVRSDEIRKELCGVGRLDPLGPEGYIEAVTARVYRTLADRATAALAGGCSVIADAVFGRAADREAIAQVARTAAVPFAALWLEAPEDTLVARVTSRTSDPSDASADVVRRQRVEPPGDSDWSWLNASRSIEHVREDAGSRLRAARLPR